MAPTTFTDTPNTIETPLKTNIDLVARSNYNNEGKLD